MTVWTLIYSTINAWFNFQLPGVALTFGGLVVGVFGLPYLVKAFKKLF